MAQSPAERERVEHHLTDQHVDGVLLLSLHDADPLPHAAASSAACRPCSAAARPGCCSRARSRPTASTSTTRAAPAQAVEYLLGEGRRRVATIAGPQDMGVGVRRLAGYREAIAASGGR